MAHASPATLDRLEPLLRQIRALKAANEPKRGIFYRGRVAFLHFHETAEAGVVADLKEGRVFARYPVSSAAERRRLIAAIREVARHDAHKT
jgi:hypothetical protein